MTRSMNGSLMVAALIAACASAASAGLVAHYRLDEFSGPTAADATGQHNAIYDGNPLFAEPGAAAGTGTSVYFDGTTAVQAESPQLPAMSALSISMWLNIDPNYTGYHMPMTRTDIENDPWTIQINPGSGETRNLAWILHHGNRGNITVPTGQWFHLGITSEAGTNSIQRLYINGELTQVGFSPSGLVDDGTQAFWIGRRGDGYFYHGGIDDVQIYDSWLNDDNIAFLYANPGQTTTGPVAPRPGDINGDGNVDGADFVIWQTNFPYTAPGSSSVPEPSTIFLTITGVLLFVAARKARRN